MRKLIQMLTAADYPAKRYEGTCKACVLTRWADGLDYLRGFFRDCVEKGHTVSLFDTQAVEHDCREDE